MDDEREFLVRKPTIFRGIRDSTISAKTVKELEKIKERAEEYYILHPHITDLLRYFPEMEGKDIERCFQGVDKEKVWSVIVGVFPTIRKNIRCFVEGTNEVWRCVSPEKTIYCFGEVHINSWGCKNRKNIVTIENLIEKTILTNQKKIIDLFIEIPFLGKKDNQILNKDLIPSPITKITSFFQECLVREKQECQYHNLRAHYTDIRQIAGIENILIDVRGILRKGKFSSVEKANSPRKTQSDYITMTNRFEKDVEFFMSGLPRFLNKTKIQKQLNNIRDKKTKAFLSKYTEDSIYDFLEKLRQIRETIKDRDFKGTEINAESLFKSSAAVMDSYTLGRIFREFGSSKSANHVIIFTGNEHTRNYANVFRRLGFDVESLFETGSDSLCVDITDFLPLFKEEKGLL